MLVSPKTHSSTAADNGELSTSDIRSAVLFSADMLEHCDGSLFPQYGLLGSSTRKEGTCSTTAADPRIFLNSNIPFSAFICGVQGSGKSHTTSYLIGEQANALL